MSNAFRARGHECFTVDWDEKFPSSWHTDISKITAQDILERFGRPDIIWVGTDCSSYSVASISKHRRKNPETGNLDPISDYAKFCDNMNIHVKELIKELNPKCYFWENPRAALRKMVWMQDMPRYTVTYCFSGDTKIITKDGYKELKELENRTIKVLNKFGDWENATVRNYGQQKLYKLTLSRAGKKKEVYTTANHKWFVENISKTKVDEVETNHLKKGMFLSYAKTKLSDFEIINEHVARGFVFGDGWTLNARPNIGSFVMFVNEKQEMLKYFDNFGGKRWIDNTDTCDIVKMCSLPKEWKTTTPSVNDDPSIIFSWLAGYIASDGTVGDKNGQVSISSSKIENLEKVRELCTAIGIDTYSITQYLRKGYGSDETPLYQLTFMKTDVPKEMILRTKHLESFISSGIPKHQARRWRVVSVEETERFEDVYCCECKETKSFTLVDGVVTHNCQYGFEYMKPTDIWTDHPNPKFKPPCKNGDTCHVSAPRGSRNGIQGVKGAELRSMYPKALCEHIVDICEEYFL